MDLLFLNKPSADFKSTKTVSFGHISLRKKILAVSQNSHGGPWCLPGGVCAEKESVVVAICRLLKEQTGITAKPSDLVVYTPWYIREKGNEDFICYEFRLKKPFKRNPQLALCHEWIRLQKKDKIADSIVKSMTLVEQEIIRLRYL